MLKSPREYSLTAISNSRLLPRAARCCPVSDPKSQLSKHSLPCGGRLDCRSAWILSGDLNFASGFRQLPRQAICPNDLGKEVGIAVTPEHERASGLRIFLRCRLQQGKCG